MKTSKIIIWSIISIVFSSCSTTNYRFITHVDRDGSCRREIHSGDSFGLLPYDLSSGWEISDTMISKKFYSVDELSTGLDRDKIFPTPKEALKKRFRWFYTYYAFTAVYPEIKEKGSVPMEKYLNKAERKFFFQGDSSDYCGMNGIQLKEKLDDIETRATKWYTRSLYEEYFAVVLHYAKADFQSKLLAVKDTLYSIHEKEMNALSSFNDVCTILDKHFSTVYFSDLYVENGQEMDNMCEERTKVINELVNYDIRYELTLPGKIIASNAYLQDNGTLAWEIDMFKFLADDFTLTAESRAVNVWAFVVTLLLVVFSVYCFCRYFR